MHPVNADPSKSSFEAEGTRVDYLDGARRVKPCRGCRTQMIWEHAMSRLFSRGPHAARSPALPCARRLRRGQFLRFARPQRLCLRAERGSLWVTVDGQPDDIELDPGDSRVFNGEALVLVSAFGGDAVLTATSLAPAPGWRQRLQAWFGRPMTAGQAA
jgi:hypothetical protein